MSAGWVAGTVRARALSGRRLGRDGCRLLAAAPTTAAAVAALAGSPYGHDVRPGTGLGEAQHAVAGTALWHLRVLAGWLPADGADALRAVAGWWELANVDELLRSWAGAPAEPAFRLGALATAWPRLAPAGSPHDLRERLVASAWGDPGGTSAWEVQLWLRLVWAQRVALHVPAARPLATAGVALLLAREVALGGRPLPAAHRAAAARVVGRRAADATGLDALAAGLPSTAHWALAGVGDRRDLWTAETRWWRRLEETAAAAARAPRWGPGPVLGTAGLLVADAWRVRSALALAGRPAAAEVRDAVG